MKETTIERSWLGRIGPGCIWMVAALAGTSAHAAESATSPDGSARFVANADGTVERVEQAGGATRRTGVGRSLRGIAVSSDGRWLLVGSVTPPALVALDAKDLAVVKVIPTADARGRPGRVANVYDAPPRASFVVAFDDIAEAWELPYGPNAEPVYEGLVHDYRLREGVAARGPFPVRRIPLEVPLRAFAFEPKHDYFVAAVPGTSTLRVMNLNVRRKIADIALPAVPAPEVSASWTRNGRVVLAIARRDEPGVDVIDVAAWERVSTIATAGIAREIAADPLSARIRIVSAGAGDARTGGIVQFIGRDD